MKALISKHNFNKALILICIMLAGCSESFLDYEKRGVQTISSFYETDEQSFEALMAVFDEWQTGGLYTYLYMHQALSDESYAGGGSRGDNAGQLEELNEFRYSSTTNCIEEHYSWLYYCVNRANLVINYVNPDSDAKALDVAMAKALRAYAYFYLVNLWGDVPLILTEVGSSETAHARTPVADVYAQIETDLSEAIAVLPVQSDLTADYPDYANLLSKGAAQAMLGKAYLFQEKYDEAAAIFQEIIDSYEYDLYPDYSKVLLKDSEFGVESVWEISYITTMGYSWPQAESALGGWSIRLSPRPEYLGYDQDVYDALDLYQYGWGFINPRKTLYDEYTNAGDLVRRNANILSPDSLQELGHKYETDAGNVPYGSDGYLRLRYLPINSEGEGSSAFEKYCNNGTNCRMIRYADVLLMAAEAYNRKSTPDDTKALQYINEVRDRVDLPFLTETGDDLFAAIKLERKLELAFEGHRYLDLQRWGDAYDVLKDQGTSVPDGTGGYLSPDGAGYEQNKNEYLPIPEYEMTVNTLMTQNTGY